MDSVMDGNDGLGIGPSQINAFGERYFHHLNRGVFDQTSAYEVFEAQFSKSLFTDNTLNIIIGTDSGLLPDYIQRKGIPNGARYIFVEPEAILTQLKAEGVFDSFDPRIVCVAEGQWLEAAEAFKITEYLYINAVQSSNALCAQDDYTNCYAELSWHVVEALSQLHWQRSLMLGSESFIIQQIANIADNRYPAILLKRAFEGKTALLLAGGPSLDAVLAELPTFRDNVVVFAVSRIARRLLEVGIEPDFIFSVDPTSMSFDISKDMLQFSSKPVFIYSHHTISTLVSQWVGRALYLGPRIPWASSFNSVNLDTPGPTVTNTALHVAHEFGFKRILLAGVDLCFTREGMTHAQGSNEHAAGPRFNLTSLEVETNEGAMAPTTCDFAAAIATLAAQVKPVIEAGCQIINLSPYSAKVPGVDYVPLTSVVLEPLNCDVGTMVDACLSTHSESDFYKRARTELSRAQYQLQAIKRLSLQAMQCNDEMYNDKGRIEDYKDKRRLDKLEQKLKRNYRHFSRLVKQFGIRRFINVTKPFEDDEWTAEEAKRLGHVYYDCYVQGAARLLDMIDNAIGILDARQQESCDHPNWALLIARCRQDQSFGRVRLWQADPRWAADREAHQTEFEALQESFLNTLNQRDTTHFKQAKRHSDVSLVRSRANLLFRHAKEALLHDLRMALDKHEDQTAVIPYRHLITAYVAELKATPEQALASYQEIVLIGGPLLEEALLRIAAISLDRQDDQTACMAFQCLSQLKPAYLPFYAEVLRLTGAYLEAIDAYTIYINQFPEDTLTQLKLVRLYRDRQINDGALMMLDYILSNHPEHEAALVMKQQLQDVALI